MKKENMFVDIEKKRCPILLTECQGTGVFGKAKDFIGSKFDLLLQERDRA
jgi:hypothetical protein